MAWRERALQYAGASNPIYAVVLDVTRFEVMSCKRHGTSAAAPQRVRLNRRCAMDALLICILQCNELAALGSKAHEF